MSNALTTTAAKGLLAHINQEAAAFDQAANELGANISGYFGFSGNDGKWKYKGQEIEHGTQIAINPERMRKGYVCWKGGKPVERVVSAILSGEPLPRKEELHDHGPYDNDNDGWAEVAELPMRFLDTGEEADISLSSKSGVNALIRLGREWATKGKMHLDDEGARKVAIVEIGANGFKSTNFPGTKYAPVLTIVDWLAAADLNEHLGAAADGEESDAQEVVEEVASKPAPTTTVKKPAGFRPGKRV